MSQWETDNQGWKLLTLDHGWLFAIDPDVQSNKGIEIFLMKEDEILISKEPFTVHGSMNHATRACEKLRQTKRWESYIPTLQ